MKYKIIVLLILLPPLGYSLPDTTLANTYFTKAGSLSKATQYDSAIYYFKRASKLYLRGTPSTQGASNTTQQEGILAKPLFNWLTGKWTGQGNGGTMYENWTIINDQLMEGESYSISKSDTVFSETMRIELLDSNIFYTVYVEHNKREISFKLIGITTNKAVFENPEHDFPTRIIYMKQDKNTLHARIEGIRNGKKDAVDFFMIRVL